MPHPEAFTAQGWEEGKEGQVRNRCLPPRQGWRFQIVISQNPKVPETLGSGQEDQRPVFTFLGALDQFRGKGPSDLCSPTTFQFRKMSQINQPINPPSVRCKFSLRQYLRLFCSESQTLSVTQMKAAVTHLCDRGLGWEQLWRMLLGPRSHWSWSFCILSNKMSQALLVHGAAWMLNGISTTASIPQTLTFSQFSLCSLFHMILAPCVIFPP